MGFNYHKVRQRREELGLSLRQLARNIGISHSALHFIETGKSAPKLETLYKIAQALNCSIAYFFDDWNSWEGAPEPSQEKKEVTIYPQTKLN